jgi:hypothetical protein
MIHDRCDSRIEYLEKLLDEERMKNSKLTEQIVVLSNHTPVPLAVDYNEEARVYYMDDAHIVELENSGRAPS